MHGTSRPPVGESNVHVVYIECIGRDIAEALLRDLGFPDSEGVPGWASSPDGTPVLVLRLGWAGTIVNRRANGTLLLP